MAEMEKKTVNAMGDVCPVPLVKAKNAIAELAGSGKVEVLVDNEIAVQNLEKMAQQKGYGFLVKEKKLLRRFHSPREHRNLIRPDMAGHARLHHLMQMS